VNKKKIKYTIKLNKDRVYILFFVKQKMYLGKSNNVCRRLGDYWHTLNNKIIVMIVLNYKNIGINLVMKFFYLFVYLLVKNIKIKKQG
jgi:hypothetical protein